MISITVAELAELTGADVTGTGELSATIVDVVLDSRGARSGSLFVALPGDHVDGHQFVETAFRQGAVAALVGRPVAGATGLCLTVADPMAALGRLARHLVDAAATAGLGITAVTGSSGKTSTKDLLAQVLEQVGPTVAPHGNLNNELGVPLTVSRIDRSTRFLVVEMGARAIGQVAYLCTIAPPQIGIVLNVGQAHVGEFGSQAAIAVAKGELVEALPADGAAVLNVDDPLVWEMRHRTSASVIAFSTQAEPATPRAVWASDLSSDDLGRHRFVLHVKTTTERQYASVALGLSGRHQVSNAVATAAAASALGVGLDLIVTGLKAAQLRSRSRMELHERSDNVLVINDAYNANPDSTRAALDTLAEMRLARRRHHPTATAWAVLGDMLELGEDAAGEHVAIGRHLGGSGIDRLIAVGEHGPAIARGAVEAGLSPERIVAVPDKAAVLPNIVPYLEPGDIVLVKASRGLALDTVAEEIWSASSQQPTANSEDPG